VATKAVGIRCSLLHRVVSDSDLAPSFGVQPRHQVLGELLPGVTSQGAGVALVSGAPRG